MILCSPSHYFWFLSCRSFHWVVGTFQYKGFERKRNGFFYMVTIGDFHPAQNGASCPALTGTDGLFWICIRRVGLSKCSSELPRGNLRWTNTKSVPQPEYVGSGFWCRSPTSCAVWAAVYCALSQGVMHTGKSLFCVTLCSMFITAARMECLSLC